MADTPPAKTRYMLDTNCFDRILDDKLAPDLIFSATVYCTGVQRDEIDRCTPPERRKELIDIFEIIDPNTKIASSFCFDIEGAGWDQACWNDGTGRFERMLISLKERDAKEKKKAKTPEETLKRQIRDIVIAETALKNEMILVTNDRRLKAVADSEDLKAVSFDEFLSQIAI